MAPTHPWAEPGPYTRGDPSGRQTACLTQGCVWKRLARMEARPDGFTPIGKLLHAYYLDLAEDCVCPHGRGKAI